MGTFQPEKLLTVSEVCAWLDLSEKQVRNLVQRKQIPYLKVSTSLRFDRVAVTAWMEPTQERQVQLTPTIPTPRRRRKPGEGSLSSPELKKLGYR